MSASKLNELRDLGVELSIDDYGTGYSSLAYMRNLPVSELKLDRVLLEDFEKDVRAVLVVQSTVDLSHSLGLRVVAEGIETAEALTLISQLGCDVGQGFFIARPSRADELFGDGGLVPRRLDHAGDHFEAVAIAN